MKNDCVNCKRYVFEEFQKKAIVESIRLDKYLYLLNSLHNCDVSADKDGFQKPLILFFM